MIRHLAWFNSPYCDIEEVSGIFPQVPTQRLLFFRPHCSCVTVRGRFHGPDDGSQTIGTKHEEMNNGDQEDDHQEGRNSQGGEEDSRQ